MVHGFDRIAELVARARLHLDERNQILLLRDEINIAPPRAKSARYDFPSALFEITGRYSLTEFAERVRGFGHGGIVQIASPPCVIESTAEWSVRVRGRDGEG